MTYWTVVVLVSYLVTAVAVGRWTFWYCLTAYPSAPPGRVESVVVSVVAGVNPLCWPVVYLAVLPFWIERGRVLGLPAA